MTSERTERNKRKGQKLTAAMDASSLVTTDSPDDFAYEGTQNTCRDAPKKESLGDKAYVSVDSPDDFE